MAWSVATLRYVTSFKYFVLFFKIVTTIEIISYIILNFRSILIIYFVFFTSILLFESQLGNFVVLLYRMISILQWRNFNLCVLIFVTH